MHIFALFLSLIRERVIHMNRLKQGFCIWLAVFLLGGCHATAPPVSNSPAPVVSMDLPAHSGGRLSIYSPLPEEEISVYLSAFRKDTGITAHCIRLPAGEMIDRVRQERDSPKVSVLLGGSADNYVQASADGLLEPYQSPELTYVPEAYLDKHKVWNPIYVGMIGFACNEDFFAQRGLAYPATWDDLLQADLAGQVVMASPETSGTSYTMLASLVQQRGEEKAWAYLRALHQNIGHYTQSGAEPVDWVKRGALAVSIVFSHDGRRAVLDGYPVVLQFPADGTGYEIGACALVRGGPDREQENAKLFIDWMTSQRGQECYIEAKSSRLPTNSTARSADGLPTVQDIQIIDYDPEWAGLNRARLVEQFLQKVKGA